MAERRRGTRGGDFDCNSRANEIAVLTAYGFSAKKDFLAQLLALNQQVAARIEKGDPVTAPGVPKLSRSPKTGDGGLHETCHDKLR